MNNPEVIGIGSIFVDYFFDAPDNWMRKNKLKPESDIFFNETHLTRASIKKQLPLLMHSAGGVSGNTMAVLSTLGIRSAYCGVVGSDSEAKYWLKSIGEIDTSRIIKRGKVNICYCLLSQKRSKRAFISDMNLHDTDFFDAPDFAYLNKAKFIHMCAFLLDYEHTAKKVAKFVSKVSGPKISFTPSAVLIRLGLKKLLPILKYTYVLFLNEDEIHDLTKVNVHDGIKKLLQTGVRIVVCTQGERGVTVGTTDEIIQVKTKEVKKIVDATGAGDAFAAGFLYGLVKNKSLTWSATFGNKIAAKSLTDFGLHWLCRLQTSTRS